MLIQTNSSMSTSTIDNNFIMDAYFLSEENGIEFSQYDGYMPHKKILLFYIKVIQEIRVHGTFKRSLFSPLFFVRAVNH